MPYTIVLQTDDPLSIAYPDPNIQVTRGACPTRGNHYGYEIFYRDDDLFTVNDPLLPPPLGWTGIGDWAI